MGQGGHRRYRSWQAIASGMLLCACWSALVSTRDADAADGVTSAESDVMRESGVSADTDADIDNMRPHWIEPRRRSAESVPPAAADVTETATVETGTQGTRETIAGTGWTKSDVVVHSDSSQVELSAVVAEILDEAGAESVERRVVEDSAPRDQVRYFHAADEGSATELATVLGALFKTIEVLDLTRFRPSPPPGSLEIWIY